jgi:serralysin
MAGEVVTTTLLTSYQVQTGDDVYVARSGQIIMNSGSNYAIFHAGSVTSVTIVIDGAVTATAGSLVNPTAIALFAGGMTVTGNNRVVIGAEGLVRSFNADGIRLSGAGSTVLNQGSVIAEDAAIDIAGDQSAVVNAGSILTGISAIEIDGADVDVSNTGSASAEIYGLIMNSESGTILNSGTISGGARGLGLGAGTSGDLGITISNSGTILGGDHAIASVFGGLAGSFVNLTNSGTISGARTGISLAAGVELTLANAAGAVIETASGPAIILANVLRLTNFGSITSAEGPAIRLGANSGFTSITNHGQIGGWSGSIDASALLTGGSLFVTNHGTISGGYTGAGNSDALKNFGLMDGLSTGNGNDNVRNAGVIDNFVLLGAGNDTYRGAGGRVEGWVDGGIGNDTLTGGADEDDLRGGTDSDTLTGRGGDDILTGSLGGDSLDGGAGNDTLIGGTEKDRLTGGADADVFRFATAAEAGQGATADVILDFEHLVDVIDVSAFMAGAAFIGNTAFTATGAEIRYVKATGLLEGDTDGNGTADWSLVIQNRPVFTAADLVT